MRNSPMLVATLFAVSTIPLMAQQSQSGDASMSPGPQSGSPTQAGASSGASAAAAPAVEMRPVKAELVSNLDSKTAKSGDNVEAKTKDSMTTAAGTEIPKGSKLVGHVVAVQPSTGGQNSQVVLRFDEAQLKGGASVPIQSEIKSIAPAGGATPMSDAAGMPAVSARPVSPSSGNMASSDSGAAGSSAANAPSSTAAAPAYAPTPSQESAAAGAASGEAGAGAIVARVGNIAIYRTSVPGVLLANNAPGERDPRMAQVSGILLGAKKDVKLEGGTELVVDVAATGTGSK